MKADSTTTKRTKKPKARKGEPLAVTIGNVSEAYGHLVEAIDKATALAGKVQFQLATGAGFCGEEDLAEVAQALRAILNVLDVSALVLRKGIGEAAAERVRAGSRRLDRLYPESASPLQGVAS